MRRRQLLRIAAALPLVSSGLAASLGLPTSVSAQTRRRVRPSDPGWPSASSWERLATSVGGNLLAVRPLLAPCETAPNSASCRDALEGISNPYWIGDQPAGTEVSGWLDAWTPAQSVYAVKAQHAADVQAAVNFAREHELRLVVKGGSHSYLGTSNAPDSLLVWTRGMSSITLHESFVGRACEGRMEPVSAVSVGAGAVWMDAYRVVTTEAGRYVQGGGCTTVGVAGLVQSGGFGSFSKRFGTAAAGLLEAEVVTADGRIRVVNECNDPDLFWALKGGGGGTFAVVTRLTLRTHDLPRFFGAAQGRIEARSTAAFARLVTRFVDFYRENLLNPQWGEQVRLGPGDTLDLAMVSQGLDEEEVRAVWRPFFDWVQAQSEDFIVTAPLRAAAGNARDWWRVEGNRAMIPDTRDGVPEGRGWWEGDQAQVGAFIHGFDSVWLPASLLLPADQPRLVAALLAASREQRVELHFNKGLAGAPADVLAAVRETATHPAVLNAFCLAIIADGEGPAYPGLSRPPIDIGAARRNARSIDAAIAELRTVAPSSGSYVSESNYFNASWQDDYWGSHYPRLRAVKSEYDPDGLFFVHHGVGSEEWSQDGFTRLA